MTDPSVRARALGSYRVRSHITVHRQQRLWSLTPKALDPDVHPAQRRTCSLVDGTVQTDPRLYVESASVYPASLYPFASLP